MSANETIIAVPIDVENPGQTRKFLVRLIEEVDIVLGYRGQDPYVTISTLQNTADQAKSNLTQLEQIILDVIKTLLASSSSELQDAIVEAIASLKSSDTITDADTSTQVVSNPPTQAEVQAIQDQVVTNANRFNDLLTALRGTEIIAT